MPVSLAALIISILLPSPATGVTGAKSKVTWKILRMVDRDFPVQQPSRSFEAKLVCYEIYG